MYKDLIDQLNFYIQQKETSAQTFVGRMVGSALHKEIDTLRSAVQAISTLIEFHDSVELNKMAAKVYFEEAENIIRLALEAFKEGVTAELNKEACNRKNFGHFSIEEICDIMNRIHSKLDEKQQFAPKENDHGDGNNKGT